MIRNVTPRGAGATSAPPRPDVRRLVIVAILLILLVLAARALFGHRENRYEKLADQVTTAIENNDMGPVAGDFDPQTRERFTKLRVARASDALGAIGKIKSVKETTPAETPQGTHYFDVTGANGTAKERMVLDQAGKIFAFDWKDVAANAK